MGKVFKFFSPLLCEEERLSVGRVGLWVLMYKALTIIEIEVVAGQVSVTEIPTNLFYLIMLFTAYNFSKKEGMFIRVIKAWKGTE